MAKYKVVNVEDAITWDSKDQTINPVIDYLDGSLFLGTYVPCLRTTTKIKNGEEVDELESIRLPAVIKHNEKEKFKDLDLLNIEDLLAQGLSVEGVPADVGKWGHNYINAFIQDKHKNNTFLEVYEEVKEELKYYIDFGDEREYDLVTCWIIATYFHQIFNTFPYLFLNATKQAGKTKCLTFASCLAFNAIPTLNQTPASLFRMTQLMRPTFLIDETDKFGKKEETDYRSLLLARYKKGLKIWRIEERKKMGIVSRTPQAFEVYGPTLLCNIEGLDDVLEDRTIGITLKRTMNDRIANREINTEAKKWPKLRNLIYLQLFEQYDSMIALHKAFSEVLATSFQEEDTLVEKKENLVDENSKSTKKVEKVVDINSMSTHENSVKVENSVGTSLKVAKVEQVAKVDLVYRNGKRNIYYILGKVKDDNEKVGCLLSSPLLLHTLLSLPKKKVRAREMELWLPIYCVAALRSEEVFKGIVDLSELKVEEKQATGNQFTIEEKILRAVWLVVKQPKFYPIKDVRDAVMDKVAEDENEAPIASKTIGRVLSRLGFKDRSRAQGLSTVYLSPDMVQDVALRLNIQLIEDVEPVEIEEELPKEEPKDDQNAEKGVEVKDNKEDVKWS